MKNKFPLSDLPIFDSDESQMKGLKAIFEKTYLEPTVDALLVPALHGEWSQEFFSIVLQICEQYEVRHLVIGDSDRNLNWILNMTCFKSKEKDPFLPRLKEITLQGTQYRSILPPILLQARVRRLNWKYLLNSTLTTQRFIEIPFAHNVDNTIDSFWSIREMSFSPSSAYGRKDEKWLSPFEYQADNWSHTAMMARNRCKALIGRNMNAFWNCQKVTIMLITMRNLGRSKVLSIVDRNVIKMIALMVWQTRGTKIWGKKESI
jgi:hypothetical protein